MIDPFIEARDVSVILGGASVLSQVDLDVRPGEVLAVVGPNGAGKSTLVGVLSGDIAPDSGTVLIEGVPMESWSSTELAVRRGVLLQQVDISFPFTATQVVRMGRAPWVGTSAEKWDDVVVADAMVETDTAAFSERVYMSLSGGERARAALARVLAQEPAALLLDEPTASLDIRHQESMLEVVRSRAASGEAVVVVIHDLSLAAAYADSVAVMSRGVIVGRGHPRDVFTRRLLSEIYEHPIQVLEHPESGSVIVTPERSVSATFNRSRVGAG